MTPSVQTGWYEVVCCVCASRPGQYSMSSSKLEGYAVPTGMFLYVVQTCRDLQSAYICVLYDDFR